MRTSLGPASIAQTPSATDVVGGRRLQAGAAADGAGGVVHGGVCAGLDHGGGVVGVYYKICMWWLVGGGL